MNLQVRNAVGAFGPAWLVMITDVDVASIITGLQAGATWGYHLIFVMLLLTLPLFIIQDAAGRLGTLVRVGLGEGTLRRYGRRTALFAAVPMDLTDFLEYVAEYAGIAIGLALLGLPILPGLGIAYLLHLAIVAAREYRQAERILLPVSFALVASLAASVFFVHVDFDAAGSVGLSPLRPYGDSSFRYLAAASIGAVVMPWMLYFHSGADSRKRRDLRNPRRERRTTLVGAVVSEVLMVAIVLVGMELHLLNGSLGIESLGDVLSPLGGFATVLLCLGFIAAGFQALLLVILTTNCVPLILSLMVSFTIVIIPSLYFLGKLVSDPVTMAGHEHGTRARAAFWAASAVVVGGGILGMLPLL